MGRYRLSSLTASWPGCLGIRVGGCSAMTPNSNVRSARIYMITEKALARLASVFFAPGGWTHGMARFCGGWWSLALFH
jgi:hypothetical protein